MARNITYETKICLLSFFLMKICTKELQLVKYTILRTNLNIQRVPEKTIFHMVHSKQGLRQDSEAATLNS